MKFLIAFLVLPAAGLLAWGVISLVTASATGTCTRPWPRTRWGTCARRAPPRAGRRATPELVETPFLQRAVAAVAEVATRRGVLQT